MYHPTARVLAVLELLQAYPILSGAAIAERLEVDRRTVRRYITMLQDMNIPIEAERGAHGGYRLRPGFKLPPLMLSNAEALAIVLSLHLASTQALPANAHDIASATAKIERLLPSSLREQLQSIQHSVALQPRDTLPAPPSDLLLLASSAIQLRQRLQIRYQSAEQETTRALDPYGLVYHWERWYLVGWCHLRQDIRVFRLDRVLSAQPQPEIFTRPADFDSLAVVLQSLANTPWGWNVSVLLQTSIEAIQRRIPPGSATLETVADGVLLRINATRLEWVARMLLMLECPFVIQQPAELREVLQQLAREVAALADQQEDRSR